MKIKNAFAALLLPVAFGVQAQDGVAKWDYEGTHGPMAWGNLDSSFAECKVGKAQSPIDIRHAKRGHLAPLAFDYHATKVEEVNNGHTV